MRQVLLVANISSGTGHGDRLIGQLESQILAGLDRGVSVDTRSVSDHQDARRVARDFTASSRAASAIIVGGGGGTLRAVIEGVWDAVGPLPNGTLERISIGALRLGSGNVVAKQFGVPLDPLQAIAGLVESLRLGRTAPCSVMRCRIGKADGKFEVRYGTAMCGLGQFGRTSGDLARWHRRVPRLRRFLARRWGIERLNDLEYVLAMVMRTSWAAIWPRACERVELRVQGQTLRLRILAGVVVNFPVKMLPFDQAVRIDEPALSFHYLPAAPPPASLLMLTPKRLATKVRRIKIGRDDSLQVRFLDPETAEFFLDEDPELAYGEVTVEVAGMLPFIPCPEYFRHAEAGKA